MNIKRTTILLLLLVTLTAVQAQRTTGSKKVNTLATDELVADTLAMDADDELVVIDRETGKQEHIQFPEAMTYDLDSLLSEYMAKTYLTPDTCHMKDENPVWTTADFVDRLHRLPTVMEMAHNDVVQQFIDRYCTRLRGTIGYALGASNFYMPIFEEALDLYQIPLELRHLPIIESALNPKAVSRVGATGLWQFMLATAKSYGLQINSLVDERRDPVKASFAAAHYLRDLYKIFGDWNLVIAAYNCGPGNVTKAIQRAGGSKDYWHIYPYLPKETRGYVPAFIAANYMMAYYSKHNICPMSSRLPAQTDTVVVSKNIHLQQIASVLNIDIEALRALNPMFRRDVVPGASQPYAIRLPQGDVSRFIEMEDSIGRFRAGELLSNRLQVAVNDEVPTYYHKSKRYVKKKSSRYTKRSKARRSKKSKARRRRRR